MDGMDEQEQGNRKGLARSWKEDDASRIVDADDTDDATVEM
jgi:hypothetical protein